MITIVDSGGNNLASILYACKRLGFNATVTQDPKTLRQASHVILPGVGSAGAAMQQLMSLDLIATIQSLTQPVLGICLGMQLLFEHSAEGDVDCLNLFPGRIKPLVA